MDGEQNDRILEQTHLNTKNTRVILHICELSITAAEVLGESKAGAEARVPS